MDVQHERTHQMKTLLAISMQALVNELRSTPAFAICGSIFVRCGSCCHRSSFASCGFRCLQLFSFYFAWHFLLFFRHHEREPRLPGRGILGTIWVKQHHRFSSWSRSLRRDAMIVSSPELLGWHPKPRNQAYIGFHFRRMGLCLSTPLSPPSAFVLPHARLQLGSSYQESYLGSTTQPQDQRGSSSETSPPFKSHTSLTSVQHQYQSLLIAPFQRGGCNMRERLQLSVTTAKPAPIHRDSARPTPLSREATTRQPQSIG